LYKGCDAAPTEVWPIAAQFNCAPEEGNYLQKGGPGMWAFRQAAEKGMSQLFRSGKACGIAGAAATV